MEGICRWKGIGKEESIARNSNGVGTTNLRDMALTSIREEMGASRRSRIFDSRPHALT